MVDGAGLHQVQFYGAQDDLAPSVCDVLAVPLLRGEAAVLIATPEHRRQVAAALDAGGLDLRAARRAGRYVELDAAATLAALTGPHGPDAQLFAAAVGSVVAGAVERFGAVSAYGEMVGLLVAEGQVVAALQLEALWSELVARYGVRLLCGYEQQSFARPAGASALHDVQAAHHGVPPIATATVAVELPAGPRTVAVARAATRRTCRDWGLDDPAWLDDVVLVVAELVGNAVRHSGSVPTLGLTRHGDQVTVAVTDGSQQVPVPRTGPQLAENGRGFAIIDLLADGWTVQQQPRGKRVQVRSRPHPGPAVIDLRTPSTSEQLTG